jgi:hypothetical protein
MAGRDGKYPNSKVGIEQGAERFFIDPDGFFNVDNNDVTGEQLRNRVSDNLNYSIVTGGAVSTSLATKNLLSNVTTIIISMTSNITSGSFWLNSCTAGREVLVKMWHKSTASGQVEFSTSGCSLVNRSGSAISGFILKASGGSNTYVRLKCFTDNEWCVIDAGGQYSE